MNDKKISEEELFNELDSMYQRVADVEKEEAAEATAIIPRKEKPMVKKKRSSRNTIIIAFISFIVLAFVLAMTVFKPMIDPLLPEIMKEKGLPKVVTLPAPKAKPSAPVPIPKEQESVSVPVPKEQEPVKTIPEEVKKAKPAPQEIKKPEEPLTKERYYAIQVGSFSNLEYARDLSEDLKKEGLDAYWIRKESKKRGTLYRVFVGHFTRKKKAAQFLKENKILNNYPDSFPRKISSSEINPL